MPEQFLEVRVHDTESDPNLLVVCAGYEAKQWRCEQFARHILDWLLEFVLPPSQHAQVDVSNCMEHLRRAASMVYTTDKYDRRGEIGELLLYSIMRQFYGTVPAISKLFFKTATNETVKGFDAVHVVPIGDALELWLGEVKLYSNIHSAIREVVNELNDHVDVNYLRREFMLIGNKIEADWPHSASLQRLIAENTSLDKVFSQLRIPVLLTYNSDTVASHEKVSAEFLTALQAEVRAHHAAFRNAGPRQDVTIHLILLPLNTKDALLTAVDCRLKVLQSL